MPFVVASAFLAADVDDSPFSSGFVAGILAAVVMESMSQSSGGGDFLGEAALNASHAFGGAQFRPQPILVCDRASVFLPVHDT